MRGGFKALALVGVLALTAAACAEEDAAPPAPDAPESDLSVCQVTDVGGVDDKSFNETAFKGLTDAEAAFGVETSVLESQAAADYATNIQTFVDQDCDLIVTVGFLLGDDTQAAAEANPDRMFTIVDFAYDPPLDNVLGQVYATDQAGFLAGYLAAGMTQTGTIGTYGGINIGCGVTCFMDGFWMGAMHYNATQDADVQVLGWDAVEQDGLFTGDFENQDNGRRVTEDLIAEGADIILPVAGPVGLGTIAAVEDSPGDDAVIWVDTDGCISVEESCSVIMTSIEKNIDVAVFDAIEAVVNGTFAGGNYQGTLENDGVGISPYHEFEDRIPDDLKAEIEELRAGIIAGDISLDPNDYA